MRYWTKDILIDPNDATQSTWYVCVYSGWGGPPNGLGGLYRTTNRGQSWTKINSLDRVGSCAINPAHANEMYLTTETNGLWYTANLSAAQPTFTAVASYPFRQPERVFFNPYNVGEIWVTSFGNGLRVGNVCGYQLASSSGLFDFTGGEATIALTCGATCAWTATSNNSWITLTSVPGGTGSDFVSFIVRGNSANAPRQGSLTVAGLTYRVIQDAGFPDCDEAALSTTSQSFTASGGGGGLSVQTMGHCAWQALPDVSWITITSGSPAIGSGSITFNVAPNPTTVARRGRIAVGSHVLTIKQKGS
jgi:hypothetical protein